MTVQTKKASTKTASTKKASTKTASTKTSTKEAARTSTQERIVAAARAVLARNPGATVDDIVRVSGVSRATFFRAYRARDVLLRDVATAALADVERGLAAALVDVAGAAVGARLSAAIAALVAHGEQLRFLVTAVELYEDPAIAAAAGAADAHIAPLIDEAVRAGLLRADLPRTWLWAATDALVFAAWHEVSVGRLARADAARVVEATLLAGFGRRA